MRRQQEQMRKQQEQMRKQQEQLRRQQMGAAWQQQQKARAEKARPHALPEQKGKDRFAQIEAEVSRLRQDLAANRLTEEQFKARLRELMVEDEQGNWWMMGYETGQWYLHDGSGWVRADPPGHVVPRPAPSPEAQKARTLAEASLAASILGVTFFPIIASIIGIILGGMARKRMRASGGTKTTERLAKAGIILGWVGIVLVVLAMLLLD